MIDETDITEEKKWLYEERAKIVVTKLRRKNISAQYVPSRQEALPLVLDMIPAGAVVGRGDSISVDQIGVIPELMKRNQNKVIDPFGEKADGSPVIGTNLGRRLQRKAMSADVFLTGTNAITLDGKLVNTDGYGNRVAAMIYGPKKVIVIAGANKIVKDLDEALERIRVIAAPINAKRHYLKHPSLVKLGDLPCVRTGTCVDCSHNLRICHYTVIIDGAGIWHRGRIKVVLIGEELGI
jgi:hypothetical protein